VIERVTYPEWRRSNDSSKYPFSPRAAMANEEGRIFVEGWALDAAMYVIGADGALFISQVEIDHEEVTFTVGTVSDRALATGTVRLINPEDNIVFEDAYGRPAGIIVSESIRLSIFQAWGVGVHVFEPDQTEFCGAVCFPTPEVGVRGVLLPDGTFVTGDVWLVGDDGVVFRMEEHAMPASCGEPARGIRVVRVDVVGDPLFRRRLCVPTDLFNAPKFIRTVRIEAPNQTFECAPDEAGDLKITVTNDAASDTVLRVVTTPAGIRIGVAGEPG
jgi:hypothetical protein